MSSVKEAKHPITGAPIRIMRTGAQLWKDGKTLYWIRSNQTQPKQPHAHTESICTSIRERSQTTFISLSNAEEPGLFEFLNSTETNKYQILLLTKEILTSEQCPKDLKNVLCLDEIHQLFPHISEEFDGTAQHAVYLLAQVIRFSRIAGATVMEQYSTSPNITYLPEDYTSPQLWLITQYYESPVTKRAKEIQYCLQKNIENPFINKIVLLNESNVAAKTATAKLEQVNIGRRLHYSDVYRYIYEKVPANTIVLFANSDIYFDNTLRPLWSIDLQGKFLALLRYDVNMEDNPTPRIFGPRPDSQDSWVVLSDCIQSAVANDPNILAAFDFPFGKNGCDNAISYEMLRQKFLVTNPAQTIITYHVHESAVRTYKQNDVIEKPVFLYLEPTMIQEFEPVSQFSKYKTAQIQHAAVPFGPKFITEKQENIFREMTRDKATMESMAADQEPIFTFNNSFQMTSGLVYSYNKLIIENNDKVKELWGASRLSILQASLKMERSIAVHLTDEVATDPARYLLFYLSRVLSIRKKVGPGCAFWGPSPLQEGDENTILDWIRIFRWSEPQLPILQRSRVQQIYSQEIHSIPYRNEIRKEDISALREYFAYPSMRYGSSIKRILLVGSEAGSDYIYDALVERQYDVVRWDPEGAEYKTTCEAFNNADVIITFLTAATATTANPYTLLGHMWMTPEGAKVIEFQNDSEPNSVLAKLSATCDHTHYIVPLTKSIASARRATVLDSIKTILTPQLLLKIPVNQVGFHAHAGDSFRELAALWGQMGLIKIQKTESQPFCSIVQENGSEIILYDRPTYRWLDAAATGASKMLVGNPAPRDSATQAPWIFWARHPAEMEAAVAAGLSSTPYKGRKHQCVFIGNIENQVQAARRSATWSNACDLWKLNAEPQLTQHEYFATLASSKYSLCLAGFGNKCHREVESMAMGTVLIVTPDVDTSSYKNPLELGVHYLRVETPEEAVAAMAEVTESEWVEMSAACKTWYKENASCTGSFKTTMECCESLGQTVRKPSYMPTFKFETLNPQSVRA